MTALSQIIKECSVRDTCQKSFRFELKSLCSQNAHSTLSGDENIKLRLADINE